MPTERSPNRLNSDSGDKKEDKKHRQRLQDALPLELPPASDTKLEIKDASYMLDGKTNGQGETINQSDPTAVPRSENFFQVFLVTFIVSIIYFLFAVVHFCYDFICMSFIYMVYAWLSQAFSYLLSSFHLSTAFIALKARHPCVL